MVGTESGRKILLRICRSVAPSITDASSSSIGTPIKAVRRMMTFHATNAFGITTAQMRLYIPSILITRNVGMSPPEKNMVNTTSFIKVVRNGKRFFARGYAVIIEKKQRGCGSEDRVENRVTVCSQIREIIYQYSKVRDIRTHRKNKHFVCYYVRGRAE